MNAHYKHSQNTSTMSTNTCTPPRSTKHCDRDTVGPTLLIKLKIGGTHCLHVNCKGHPTTKVLYKSTKPDVQNFAANLTNAIIICSSLNYNRDTRYSFYTVFYCKVVLHLQYFYTRYDRHIKKWSEILKNKRYIQ